MQQRQNKSQENRLVPRLLQKDSRYCPSVKKVPVCPKIQQWYGPPWKSAQKAHKDHIDSRSGQAEYSSNKGLTGRIRLSVMPIRIKVPDRIINGRSTGTIFSYQSFSPNAAYARLREECVRIQQVITTKNRFRIFFS